MPLVHSYLYDSMLPPPPSLADTTLTLSASARRRVEEMVFIFNELDFNSGVSLTRDSSCFVDAGEGVKEEL